MHVINFALLWSTILSIAACMTLDEMYNSSGKPVVKQMVLAVHGMFSNHEQYEPLTQELSRLGIDIFVSSSNPHDKMFAGVRKLCVNLMDEFIEHLKWLYSEIPSASFGGDQKPILLLSVVGHSQGGVIGRYFTGWFFNDDPMGFVVNDDGSFDEWWMNRVDALQVEIREIHSRFDIRPVAFYAVASPNLGITSSVPGYGRFQQSVGRWVRKHLPTMSELVNADTSSVLDRLNSPSDVFLRALKKYYRLTFVGLVQDWAVQVGSAALMPHHSLKSFKDSRCRIVSYHNSLVNKERACFTSFEGIEHCPSDGKHHEITADNADSEFIVGSDIIYKRVHHKALANLPSRCVVFDSGVNNPLVSAQLHGMLVGQARRRTKLPIIGKHLRVESERYSSWLAFAIRHDLKEYAEDHNLVSGKIT